MNITRVTFTLQDDQGDLWKVTIDEGRRRLTLKSVKGNHEEIVCALCMQPGEYFEPTPEGASKALDVLTKAANR